jgi:O-antigen ligase
MYSTWDSIKQYVSKKDNLTLWMNNFLVVYAFLLPISQTIKATIFSFILILFLLRGDVVKHIKDAFTNKVLRAFLYFFLIYVVGMVWTENIAEGFDDINKIKYGLYLILFYTFVDGRYINKVITAFILGMLVSELTSYGIIFEFLPWKLELGGILFYQAYNAHDPSPFLHHIHYGVALAFVVILLGQKIYYSHSGLVMKIFMSIFVLTATANIFFTGGRTGYIAFILLMFTLAVFYLKKWALAAIVFVVLVLGIAYNSSILFKNKVEETRHSIEKIFSEEADFGSSLGNRAGIYYYGSQVVANNPFFGVGTGDSMDEIYKLIPEKWNGLKAMPHEHNQFFSVLVKLGIVGLLIFLNIYYQIFKYKQEDKELRFIMIFATLAIAFGTLTTQFNLRFFMPLWAVMLAVTLISRERRTIVGIELNDKTQLLQIIFATAAFGIASLCNQLF